ncbi:sigma-70 family RNA polymerase sigma factor [Roseococcus sp.]|uniref:sigma-70 family RNA polymerase sigma factor n=1 Tax=Roseococcus sp. TaxID=2109646 RepID=UPI003BAC6DBA
MPRPDAGTTTFEAHRPRLLRFAYRMLGSMAEAEDAVQDAWLRWSRVAQAEVREPAAFLTRTVTHLCLDAMKSARARRETYVGSWLPEPILDDHEEEEMRPDELTLTLMLALERLSPLERAAFLLHDVFGVPLDEVATTLDRQPASVRQLAVRARQHLREARPRYPVPREEGDRIARAFYAASHSGDLAALRVLLAENVTLQADGGGKVLAFRNPILGLAKVLRLFQGLARKGRPSVLVQPQWIDGLPGYVSLERGIVQTTALAIEEGRITAIYITRNPDKLARVMTAIET